MGLVPEPLHALAYLSTPSVAFSDRDVTGLLFSARRANAALEITGKLVVLEDEGAVVRFLQWIEGPPQAVAVCFERIEGDPRHRDIDVRFRGPIVARRFPTWDMAIDTATPTSFPSEVEALVSVLE